MWTTSFKFYSEVSGRSDHKVHPFDHDCILQASINLSNELILTIRTSTKKNVIFLRTEELFPFIFLESPHWVFFLLFQPGVLQTELCSTHTSQSPPQTQCRNTPKSLFSFISYVILDVQSLFSLNNLVCLFWLKLRHSGGEDIHELKPTHLQL